MGCMSFLAMGFVAFLLFLGGLWYLYAKAVDMFTAERPIEIAATLPTEAEYAAAEAKANEMRNALRSGRATTIAFTAPELNALIARDPDLARQRGRMRVDLADSMATLEMSVPLSGVNLPRVKHRWFNGSARFGFKYDESGFDFDPEWIEANGRQLSRDFLQGFANSFSGSFTKGFRDSVKREGGTEAWENVKSISIEGNQLIIVTSGDDDTI